ncbi:MAG: S-methyl-5'-thioadenosine phosphorylase [Desulfobacterales bacterium]
MKPKANVGIIGGSGLYAMAGLSAVEEVLLNTPFGSPSDAYILGRLDSVTVAFLPRHGRGHRLTPSELNYRANIYWFKMLGVTHLIAVSAVGSLREEIRPLDIVVADQFFDRTRQRSSTFFGDGLVAHVPFADPVCGDLSRLLHAAARDAGATVHGRGTMVCMEGPAFSTRAESEVYRRMGMDIIGMTTLTEAKLAREAELCYGVLALVTDYDCWHAEEADVSVAAVVENLKQNVSTTRAILQRVIPRIPALGPCPCQDALQHALMTRRDLIPAETLKRLEPIVGRYYC